MPGSLLFWKYSAFTATGFLVGALIIDRHHALAGHLIGLAVIGLLIAADHFVARYRRLQAHFDQCPSCKETRPALASGPTRSPSDS